MLPQTFSWGSQSDSPCYPTVAELRNMVYSGLASGVKGVVSYDFSFDLINNQKTLWKEYSDLRKDALKAEAYLLNSKVKRQNTGDAELIYSYWERGDTTLMIVVNASYSNTKTLNLALNKNYSQPKAQSISSRYAETPQIIANKITGNLQANKVMMFKLYNDAPTSNEQSVMDKQISIYPNLAIGKLYIHNLAPQSIITICDIAGKSLLSIISQSNSETIDISSLQAVVYLVKVDEVTKKISVQ